ncbi:MAG: FG-GAP repeat protein [Alphaproteobacteria bacterium]|nr:FG-GAP repeat protein [Alphaproteobacteria bacterium]
MITFAAWLACTPECGGPSCESAWPASRLLVVRSGDLGPRTTTDDVRDAVLGSLPDGAGWSVDGRVGALLVGMPERGSIAVVDVPTGEEPVEDVLSVRLDRQGEGFGTSVAWADTDGDGEPELWVGAPDADGGRGIVYRFPPGTTDPAGYDLRIVGGMPADGFGTALVACGDVTGDGLQDLLATSPRFAEPTDPSWTRPGDVGVPRLAGAVVLLASERLATGRQAPWDVGPVWWGPEAAAGAGYAMACGSDLTGDGSADVAIGAPFVGSDDTGVVFVQPGGLREAPGGMLTEEESWTVLPRETERGRFGASLATVDGALVVGAPAWSGGQGAVVVYDDVPRFPGTAVPVARFTNPRAEPEHFGKHVAVGDLDADGLWDLWVGAPDRRAIDATNDARSRYDIGWGWVWWGSGREGWSAVPAPAADAELGGRQPFERVGRATVLRDLDGDGRAEVLDPVRAPDPGTR